MVKSADNEIGPAEPTPLAGGWLVGNVIGTYDGTRKFVIRNAVVLGRDASAEATTGSECADR